MKISIVTPTYNSQETIRDTLESIKSQSYKNFELICIDGLSSDTTLEIISEYTDYFDIKIVSEKDAGIYDAMNKGINLVSGDIVHILNSDDVYFAKSTLQDVANIFSENNTLDMVYGDIRYFGNLIAKTTRLWVVGEYVETNLNSGWIIPHPGLFVKNSFYKNIDKKFDTRLRIAADYEFILRSLKVKKAKVFYLQKIVVSMREGGVSRKQFRLGWKEKRQAWKINNLNAPHFFIFRMLCNKIGQFLVKFYR